MAKYGKFYVKFSLILMLTTALFFSFLGHNSPSSYQAIAQEPTVEPDPPDTPPPPENKGDIPLEIQDLTTNFSISVTANSSSVQTGGSIVYTINIQNTGPNDGVLFFYADYPSELQNVSYSFSRPAKLTTIFNNPKPTYTLEDPLPVNATLTVKVSGKLFSVSNVTTKTTVTVTNLVGTAKSATANVSIQGSGQAGSFTIFMPIIAKPPPVILAYLEPFSTGNTWAEGNFGDGCETEHRPEDNTYRVKMTQNDKSCLPPARNEPKPDIPFRTYGEFQVEVFDTGDDRDDDAWYGIFINGQGGDNYYVFRVRPNADGCTTGGNWEFRRRRNGNESLLASANCVSALKRGYGTGAKNTLKIVHKSDRTLNLFINNVEVLASFTESASQHLTGTATGIYVRSDNQIIRIKFDNFQVNKFQ